MLWFGSFEDRTEALAWMVYAGAVGLGESYLRLALAFLLVVVVVDAARVDLRVVAAVVRLASSWARTVVEQRFHLICNCL